MPGPMNNLMRVTCITLAALAIVSTWVAAGPPDRGEELERLRRLVEEVQPGAAELAGFPVGEPIEVAVKTRSEIRDYMIRMIEISNPDGDLYHRGRCFAGIGLLPEGFDFEAGMVNLVTDEAGGLYDPFSKKFWGILDMPAAMRSPYYQKLIASHELTHALQDRVTDMVELLDAFRENPDYEYAFRAVIEGMATVVMFAYTGGLGVDEVPDPTPTMRQGFKPKAGAPSPMMHGGSPVYVKELLISPYAEGAIFVQAWQQANPELELAALMKNIPRSSEQVLHPEKYFEPDEPTAIDLSGIDTHVPDGWEAFHATTVGEFDLLTLFSIYEDTQAEAAELAAGWDGLRLRAFEDHEENVMLLGSSRWDTEQDAREFHTGFSAVLGHINDPGDFKVIRDGAAVDFVIGSIDGDADGDLLAALQTVTR